MLDFVEDSKKKIAYSTSFGHSHSFFPSAVKNEVAHYIRKLDYISVREKNGVNLVENFGTQAEAVCDPVFLIDKSEYVKLAENAERKTSFPYVMSYMLDPDEIKISALKLVSAELGLSNITIPDRQFDYPQKLEKLKDVGGLEDAKIEEWLWHFINSDFIVTDSFHGLCFALIFEKTFVCILNSRRGGVRIENLLETVGLSNRLINNASEICNNPELLKKLMIPVNYEPVNIILNAERERGRKWLMDAINAPKDTAVSSWDILNRENSTLRKQIMYLEQKLNRIIKYLGDLTKI